MQRSQLLPGMFIKFPFFNSSNDGGCFSCFGLDTFFTWRGYLGKVVHVYYSCHERRIVEHT